jgi:hypothetical protein
VLAQEQRSTDTRKAEAAPEAGATTKAAAPAPAAARTVVSSASPPRPPPPDDPLGRVLARAVAARAPAVAVEVGGLDELVDELAATIWKRKNKQVHYTLKFEAFRLDQIMERFRARKGRSLRATLIAANSLGEHRDKEFVRAMAVLAGGPDAELEPWAQMGLALIPLGTRDIDLMRLLEERPLAQRKRLKAAYDKAFAGIGKTANDTLEEHIVSDMSGWEREKALALLDHELTPADHLAISGAHDETALEILRGVWLQGPAAFDALYEDWHRFVQGPGFTPYPLEQAMAKELGGTQLEAAQAIFAEYHAMRRTAGLRDFGSMEGHEGSAERADVRLQERTIEIALQSGIFTSNGPLVISAARDLRKAWEKRIKRDKSLAAEWVMRRERLLLLFAESLGLRGADMVEARIQLVRDPGPADKIYVASMRREYEKVLDAATEAWMAGSEEGLDRALRHPPAGDPRPALAVNERAIPLNDDSADAYAALTSAQLTHIERGAVRLQLALHGRGGTTKAADLDTAYKLLKSMKDDKLRTAVIQAYVVRYLDDPERRHGNPVLVEDTRRGSARDAITRFCNALQSDATGFEQSPVMIDLLHLLAPGTELADAQAYAQRRDRATHTGVLDVAATGLVSIYDTLTAEDTQEVADDALARLRRWVRSSHASPQELKAVMEAEDVTEVSALAQLGYERFAVRLDEVRSVKASVAEGVGMFVDFAGRSLLVAVLGPAGLPGLLAALGSYTAGMLVREGLLGVEYQTMSVQNLSTLLAEVATFGFDELMIENVIKDLVPAGAAKGRIFGAQGLSDAQAKFAQEYLKGAGAKLFEKAAQNMVEGSTFPTADQLLARAGHAFAAAGLKAVSGKILTSPTVFTPTAERFRETLKKVILNGPPPKAAIGYAMAKELTDMIASPDWGNTTLQEKLARVTKAGITSIVSAVPVAVAFTSLGAREAARAKRFEASHPDVFYARLQSDPLLSAAYEKYSADIKDLRLPGVGPQSFAKWVNRQPRDTTDAAKASALKDLYDSITPHSAKRWNR